MSNPFLTKKDPLLEAVQGAMQDGALRRQAEALVNEEFGVYSRKAVVREHLADYDATLEEVYGALKEGVQLDELLGRGKLDAAVKSHLEKKGYTHSKDKDPQGGTRHSFTKPIGSGKKMEGGFSYTRYKEKGEKHGDVNYSTFSKAKTGKNAGKRSSWESGNDPESELPSHVKRLTRESKLADKDYDKDGKIESPKDEVWGSRLRAAKMAGKLKEEQIDEAKYYVRNKVSGERGQGPSYSYSPAPKGHKGPVYTRHVSDYDRGGGVEFGYTKAKNPNARPKKQTLADIIGKKSKMSNVEMEEKKMWEGVRPDPNDPSYQGGGDVTSSPMKQVRPSDPDRIRNFKDPRDPSVQTGNDVTKGGKPASVREGIGDYIRGKVADVVASTPFGQAGKALDTGGAKASEPDMRIMTPVKKPAPSTPPKEGSSGSAFPAVNESVTRKHFQQVADLIKSHDSQDKRNELASHHAGIFAKQNPRFNAAKFHAAAGSTAHQEPKKVNEAAYSAKAARAGKDIGKPGKAFSKIAKSAGERYGSEERGKKVAGAILKRIRAKHMKEEQSFNAALLEAGKAVEEQMAGQTNVNKRQDAQQAKTRQRAFSDNPRRADWASPQDAVKNVPKADPNVRPATTPDANARNAQSAPPAQTGGSAGTGAPRASAPSPAAPPANAAKNNAPATPKTDEKPAQSSDTYADGRNKSAFQAAFDKAYELGGSKARFKFNDKEYQAAKTSDEYVKRSAQKEVDIGDLSKNTPAPTASASTPNDTQAAATPAAATPTAAPGGGTQQNRRNPTTVAESVVAVGDNKYRIL